MCVYNKHKQFKYNNSMLASKRSKIHNDIRKNDLNRLFTMKRKSLLEGNNVVIKEMYNEVRRNEHEVEDYDLISRLLQCLQMNHDDQNAYITIGNYLLDHNHSYPHFYHAIVDHPKIIENHSWCLFQLANIVFEQYLINKEEHQDNKYNKLSEILMSTTNVCLSMNESYNNQHMVNKKYIIYNYFLEIFKLTISSPVQSLIEESSIKIFCQIVSFYANEKTGEEDLVEIWKFMYVLCGKWEIFSSKLVQQLFIRESFNIIMMGLKKLPFQRENIIKAARKMLLNNPGMFVSVYYNDKFLTEILYLFDEVFSLKPLIIKLLIDLISQTDLNQLVVFLNLRCHIQITQCLQWSMQNHQNECLEDCLLFIYNLMNRLNEMNEKRLLQRIQKEMSEENFNLMVQGLIKHEQNQGITNVVNNLIDDFYSQQVLL